ncbi:aminotransferase class III-fold pyridoxal phosphate-dependent enzyme [Microbacterium sp.]|uniref:aminotransferase class III-fold pyridoxal phosphate-dependent enzyme n=1 Tax=Microbacterium sp. TaxID=51671 RepID=UPI0037CADA68
MARTTEEYRAAATSHLWRHFANPDASAINVMVRGEGCYLYNSDGQRFLDGVSNMFCANLGYSYGDEFAEAAGEQLRTLGYQAIWGSASTVAIELAERIISHAPEGIEHVFFTPSGGESVEAAWKFARQYFQLRGEKRWKALSRRLAYHGTTLGALALMGLDDYRTTFEPVVPGGTRFRNTYRGDRPEGETEEEFTAFLLADLEERILEEDPSTIAMIIVEPLQNHGGCLVPPAGYGEGVRALCDKYGILLVTDEVITGFGRVGAWFASTRYGFEPDMITVAKGLSAANAPMGAVLLSEKLHEEFSKPGVIVNHGNTFGGHPVSCAIALRAFDIMERLDLPGYVASKEGELRAALESLQDIPNVVSVSGAGFFYAIELTRFRPDGTQYAESELGEVYGPSAVAAPLAARGVLCRVMVEGGRPLMFIGLPLVADTSEFEFLRDNLRDVFGQVAEAQGWSRADVAQPVSAG